MRKKLLSTPLLLLLCQLSFAQDYDTPLPIGTISFGGTFGYSKTSGGGTSSEINILPAIEYIVSRNTSGGIRIGYTSITNESFNFFYNSLETTKTSLWSVAPYGRQYIQIGEHILVYLEVQFLYSYGEKDTKNGNAGSRTSVFKGYVLGFTPGLSFFLNDRIAIEASIGQFSYQKIMNNNLGASIESIYYEFELNTSLLQLGIKYYFGGR